MQEKNTTLLQPTKSTGYNIFQNPRGIKMSLTKPPQPEPGNTAPNNQHV